MAESKQQAKQIQFRIHPRVFAALGADLVTNDLVAVIELVKNSYDAFAQNVHVRFKYQTGRGPHLEIEDDGHGMTREVVEEVWCVVATPHKQENPWAVQGAGKKRKRRVTGAKGLGRLSTARLGRHLVMLTQAQGDPCWKVTVDWSEMSKVDDLEECTVSVNRFAGKSPFPDGAGTRLSIYDLREQWDDKRISDLKENLARLVSPFSSSHQFQISLSRSSVAMREKIEIESPKFLSNPIYRIQGTVNKSGNVHAKYEFVSIEDGIAKKEAVTLTWRQVCEAERKHNLSEENRPGCGPFAFEIRAWDTDKDAVLELADKFDIQKGQIRKAIRAHKGISIYRDGFLVLPKSESARDWLGLDLRRVSKVGTRLSTSQIVGYVSISADKNPSIEDTSDRERLAACIEVTEFEEILKAIVSTLENLRDRDRKRRDPEKPLEDLFEGLSVDDLLEEVETLSAEGASVSDAESRIREFCSSLTMAREAIEERFIHYGQLATVGTIANMLVHEIRSRTTAFGYFLKFVEQKFGPFADPDIQKHARMAERAINALEHLADTFLPLASRNFRRRKRRSILESRIKECLELHRGEIKRKRVQCKVPRTLTPVAVDPGELDSIILNLVTNAVYWMSDMQGKRELSFRLLSSNNKNHVKVKVCDTGPGIPANYTEKIFWPGVTSKPGGIGMGLTVAQQLVAAYGGKMKAGNNRNGGAAFTFDLPLYVKRSKSV